MNLHEANEKMQAEKAYSARLDECCGQASPAQQQAGYCIGDNNLLDQLSMRRSISADEASRLNRAISILKKHPEFEDLLWLIRSGLV